MPDTVNPPGSRRHEKYERLVQAAKRLPAVTTAVAHPCDDVSLESAIEAAQLDLIVPILVGPAARIRDVAARAGSTSVRSKSLMPPIAMIRRRKQWSWYGRVKPKR